MGVNTPLGSHEMAVPEIKEAPLGHLGGVCRRDTVRGRDFESLSHSMRYALFRELWFDSGFPPGTQGRDHQGSAEAGSPRSGWRRCGTSRLDGIPRLGTAYPRAPFQLKVPSLHPDLPRGLVSTQLLPLRVVLSREGRPLGEGRAEKRRPPEQPGGAVLVGAELGVDSLRGAGSRFEP